MKGVLLRICVLALGTFVAVGALVLINFLAGPSADHKKYTFGVNVPPLFVDCSSTTVCTNDIYAKIGQAVPQTFNKHKQIGVFRVIVFGESSVTGWPDEKWGGFPRLLRDRLQKNGIQIEIINAGVSGFHSGKIRAVFNQTLALKPDLVVFYMGHNEYGHYLWNRFYLNIPPFLMKIIAPLTFSHLMMRLTRENQVQMAHFVTNPFVFQRHAFIPFGDSWKRARIPQTNLLISPDQKYYRDILDKIPKMPAPSWRRSVTNELYLSKFFFRMNMKSMLEECRKRKIPAIVCTVSSNLRDFPPLVNFHGKELSDAELAAFEEGMARAKSFLMARQGPQAELGFKKALSIDPSYAEAHFLLAHACLLQGKRQEAKEHYLLARDLSPAYCSVQRAPSSLNELLRIMAKPPAVTLVDTEQMFFDQSADGIPGLDVFLDNLHPNKKGAELIAKCLYPAILEIFDKWKVDDAEGAFRK